MLGPHGVTQTPAVAPGLSADPDRPGCFRAGGNAGADGVVLDGLSQEAAARLDHAQLWLGGTLREVALADGLHALAAVAGDDTAPPVADPAFCREVLVEVMAAFRQTGPSGLRRLIPGIERRAWARRAGADAPAHDGIRSDRSRADIAALALTPLHTGFFALDGLRFRHRRFDGGLSDPVARTALGVGDAVTVLPYDPATDTVLLIEQVRVGPLMRGEANPWSLEAVAGLVDPGETCEAAARREAQEEAGIEIGQLHRVAAVYAAPGCSTEFMTVYVGEADLTGAGGTHGLASETEDIRAMVLPADAALALLDTGAARNAPLALALMGLRDGRAAMRRGKAQG